jgi:hypothetical protein
MNPRYLAYCKAHGNTPEEQKELDEREYPGGSMCGFMLWVSQKKQKFSHIYPEGMIGHHIFNQDMWDEFLGIDSGLTS